MNYGDEVKTENTRKQILLLCPVIDRTSFYFPITWLDRVALNSE